MEVSVLLRLSINMLSLQQDTTGDDVYLDKSCFRLG